MSYEKEKKVFKRYLTTLGFEFERQVKHGERWKHSEKSIFYQLAGSPSDTNWTHNARRQFQKLISSNFNQDEINELLKPYIKKNKVIITKTNKLLLRRRAIPPMLAEDRHRTEMMSEEQSGFQKLIRLFAKIKWVRIDKENKLRWDFDGKEKKLRYGSRIGIEGDSEEENLRGLEELDLYELEIDILRDLLGGLEGAIITIGSRSINRNGISFSH